LACSWGQVLISIIACKWDQRGLSTKYQNVGVRVEDCSL
jgi:hypothetical protein